MNRGPGPAALASAAPRAGSSRLPLGPVLAVTVFLGSFLLFLVQPLFGRMLLPLMGGAPAVWATALVFFQAALLAGYLWAHLIQRLPVGRQVGLHLGLLALCLPTLPLSARPVETDGSGLAQAAALLSLMAGAVGPVFVAVSAQAPLLQAWLARARHPAASDPYPLYAASNAGSVAGLLAYPLLLEPAAGLALQSSLWTAGYVLLVALVAACGLLVLRTGARPPEARAAWAGAEEPPAPGALRRLRWILLAAVPSGLLVSTTSHITTDIMALPLLWVPPLALYLLSFILAFSGRGPAVFGAVRPLAPVALVLYGAGALLMLARADTLYGLLALLLLFLVSLVLNGALAADRPPPARLTEFYLLVALGGVLGGAATALLAPLVFDWTWEHPLLLLAAALLVPARAFHPALRRAWAARGAAGRLLRVGLPPLALALSWWAGGALDLRDAKPAALAALAALGLFALLAVGRPIAFTFHLAMLMLAAGGWRQLDLSLAEGTRTRSFFGVYTVETLPGRGVRRLLHGTTLHGLQSLDPARATEPLSYYGRASGVGLALGAAPRLFGPGARIGFVGLGAGTLACHAEPDQAWVAFEIDPAVVAIARDRAAFTYVARCKPDLRIVVGDARLRLAGEPAGALDMLAVDAFSSDAIPLHLLTVEALRTYFRALAPRGVLLLHISNRFLDLEPVVAANARALGASARILDHAPGAADLAAGRALSASRWVALARSEADMARFLEATASPDWAPLREPAAVAPWTDDRASILPVLKPGAFPNPFVRP